MRKNLTRNQRLNKNGVQLVFERATFVKSGFGLLFYSKNNLENSRFAPVLNRKYGNAVMRNYAKRLLREFFRQNKQGLKTGYDIVVLIKKNNLSYRVVKEDCLALLGRALLIVC